MQNEQTKVCRMCLHAVLAMTPVFLPLHVSLMA
jgi:hypothetical protein